MGDTTVQQASTQPRRMTQPQQQQSGAMRFSNLIELEAMAKLKLTPNAYNYYASGGGGGETVQENRDAFRRLRLLPRIMVDVSAVDTSISFFGRTFSMPVFVAPMAMQRMAHPGGELAVARACSAVGTSMVPRCLTSGLAEPLTNPAYHTPAGCEAEMRKHKGVSTMATATLEDVAAASRDPAALFFQLYVLRDREFTRELVERAEKAGYAALAVTVDAPRLGRREADVKNRFLLPDGLKLANLEHSSLQLPVYREHQDAEGSGIAQVFTKQIDASLTWDFVAWLRTVTRLPIYVKGVLAPADAQLAVRAGVDGIILSNHGGRQCDCVPAAVEMLPHVIDAIGHAVPLIVDGGIRRGTDVLKALALGADAVLLGRPVLWGLTLGGQRGVEQVLRALHSELELAMVLTGCPSLKHITRSLVLGPGGQLNAGQQGRSML